MDMVNWDERLKVGNYADILSTSEYCLSWSIVVNLILARLGMYVKLVQREVRLADAHVQTNPSRDTHLPISPTPSFLYYIYISPADFFNTSLTKLSPIFNTTTLLLSAVHTLLVER